VRGAWGSRKGGPSEPKSDVELYRLCADMEAGQSHPFFCSRFVAFVYQCAAIQLGLDTKSVVPMDDEKVPPAVLAQYLASSGAFFQVGGMELGQR
jgi:hypothetical protein